MVVQCKGVGSQALSRRLGGAIEVDGSEDEVCYGSVWSGEKREDGNGSS